MTVDDEPPGHLLMVSQVFPPDPAAVGQYLDELAISFAERGWDVTVLSASRGYDDPGQRFAKKEERDGLRIRRFGLSSFGKSGLFMRLLAQLLFVAQATAYALFRCPRGTRVLISTSPPFAGALALVLNRLRNFPFSWWVMDINPDQSIEAGVMNAGHPFVRCLDTLNRWTLKRADAVLTLDEDMATRLAQKRCQRSKLEVLPLWTSHGLGDRGKDRAIAAAIAEELELEGKFVILYSGNHSLVHPMTTLLEAARLLQDEAGIVFIFSGGGAGRAMVEKFVSDHGLLKSGSVRLLPYQPVERLEALFLAADVHMVAMGEAMVGCVHPSKTYSALACGRPPVWIGPKDAALAQLIVDNAVGWCFEHGQAVELAEHFRELAVKGRDDAEFVEWGQRAAALAEKNFSRRDLVQRACDFLGGVKGGAK